MSPRRRSRRRNRCSRRIIVQFPHVENTFEVPAGWIPVPDGWQPEAGKDYGFITASRYGEPDERWYRVMPAKVAP